MIKVACAFDVVSACNKTELILVALWPLACVQIVNMDMCLQCAHLFRGIRSGQIRSKHFGQFYGYNLGRSDV